MEKKENVDSIVDILVKGMRSDTERLKWIVEKFYKKN